MFQMKFNCFLAREMKISAVLCFLVVIAVYSETVAEPVHLTDFHLHLDVSFSFDKNYI